MAANSVTPGIEASPIAPRLGALAAGALFAMLAAAMSRRLASEDHGLAIVNRPMTTARFPPPWLVDDVDDGDYAAKVSCCENVTGPQKLPF